VTRAAPALVIPERAWRELWCALAHLRIPSRIAFSNNFEIPDSMLRIVPESQAAKILFGFRFRQSPDSGSLRAPE
jgi:hypothetical protein